MSYTRLDVLEPSQFVSYDCLGSKVGASMLRLDRRSGLELAIKCFSGF